MQATATTANYCEDLLAITERAELRAAIGALLSGKERQLWDAARQRLRDRETILAVLGRQGIGKSTLINALVGRRILAIDETETTNVLCLMKAPGVEGEGVDILFEDGHVEQGPLEEAFVRCYTDEQVNPGNVKKVQKLICRIDSPLLESGITIADTPGVGSLTQRTGQVTTDFLPRITTGIFLLGTSPTLLMDESVFLRSTWSFSHSFLFVQNAWAANEKEPKDAKEDNLRKLREIAADENYTGEVELHLVDAHMALEGVCNGLPDVTKQSGLDALRGLLQDQVARGAAKTLISANGTALASSMVLAGRAAATRITAILHAENLSDADFASQSDLAHAKIDDISERWQEARTEFRKDWQVSLSTFTETLDQGLSEAEDRLLQQAEQRSMDAKRLEKAVSDELLLAVKTSTQRLHHSYGQAASEFSASAQELSLDLQLVNAQNVGLGALPEDLKWSERFEKCAAGIEGLGTAALTVMGGLAIFAGVGAVGEGLAAGAAAACAAVPAVGWAVAAGVLVAGWLWKKHQEEKVIAQLRTGIQKAVRETGRKVGPGVRKAIEDHAREIDAALDLAMRANLQQQRGLLEQLRADRRKSGGERCAELALLEQMAEAFELGIQDVRALIDCAMGGC